MNDRDLIQKAANLAQVAPQPWREFLDALHKHVERLNERCVQASKDSVFCTQGEARQATWLVKTFEDAVKTSGRINKQGSL